ncbi:MAG TPA: hypothetical protein VGB79_09790 [Allosphingosinicella sp.]
MRIFAAALPAKLEPQRLEAEWFEAGLGREMLRPRKGVEISETGVGPAEEEMLLHPPAPADEAGSQELGCNRRLQRARYRQGLERFAEPSVQLSTRSRAGRLVPRVEPARQGVVEGDEQRVGLRQSAEQDPGGLTRAEQRSPRQAHEPADQPRDAPVGIRQESVPPFTGRLVVGCIPVLHLQISIPKSRSRPAV